MLRTPAIKLKTMIKELANTEEKNELTTLTPPAINLLALEKMLNKFLSPFVQQAEQNHQLMLILRQMLEQNALHHQPVQLVAADAMPERFYNTAMDIPEISFAKVKTIEPLIRTAIEGNRHADAIQTFILFLHTLYHLNGKSYAEQMFGLLGISSANGYRLIGHLRKAYLVKMYRGEIMMTDLARRIYECTITIEEIKEIRIEIAYPNAIENGSVVRSRDKA